MGLILGLAVQLRTNVWIMVIAFLITIVVKLIGKWDRRILATGICALAGVVLIHAAHWGWYADKVDPKAQSVPASLYFIMGLNDDYQRNGWYNNYNYHAFAISDYDVKTANAKAREDFQTYINLYTSQPEYFVDFFERKMNAQWNAPMYQCLKMNNNIEEKLNPLLADIYDGQRVGKLIDWGMKVYQLLLYAAILVWTVTSLKKQKGVEQYILLIAVFGGFLFSLIWEAKTRYMFPYLLLMLPYGAMGVHVMTGGLEAWVKKRKEKKREELSLMKGDGSAQA